MRGGEPLYCRPSPEHRRAQHFSSDQATPARIMIRKRLVFTGILLAIAIIFFKPTRNSQPGYLSPFGNLDRTKLDFSADIDKQSAIRAAFKHAWDAYRRDAWGFDDYHPLKRGGTNLVSSGGIGYTIVDALDTLHIMGLDTEFTQARDWVATELTFDRDGKFNAFEVTIRVLGGLLSAYHLSKDEIFLQKAVDLAERLLPIFNTQSGIPLSFINLKERQALADSDNQGFSSTAEAATLQLEFKYLSYLTEDYVYWNAAEKVMDVIRNGALTSGLVPIFIRPSDGQFITSDIRFGSRGDSYYEYLLKQYLQTNQAEQQYREMYDHAMTTMHHDLVRRTPKSNMLFIAELSPKFKREEQKFDWKLVPKQDHLVCFLGGSLLLGVTEGQGPFPPEWDTLSNTEKRDWITGEELIKTCVETYNTATGLGPEIAHFKMPGDPDADSVDWYIKGLDRENPSLTSFDARYILRPETVESLFLAWRLTGNQTYRDQGWKIFQAIEKYTKVEGGGYTSILNVNDTNTQREDKMETFFLSETLKYLYLLFSDSALLSLDKYVFNTEAHPLPRFDPPTRRFNH